MTVGPASPDYNWLGMLTTIGVMLSNILCPRWLGGVDRPYLTASGFANLPDMERVSRLAVEGKLKMPIDSVWNLEDALKVCVLT